MPAFHLVDVFATEKYAGNQLALVERLGGVGDEPMQAIAAEMGRPALLHLSAVDRGR